jgi:NADPH2:quinone reductase
LPYVPGYEAAGVVDALGPTAPGAAAPPFRVGDPVLALLLRGGYAEQVVAPVGQVYARPEGMDAVTAAALPVQALTAYYALFETGTVRPGDRVLIHAAAGGVGLLAVQMALHAGATSSAPALGRQGGVPRRRVITPSTIAPPTTWPGASARAAA